jgi:phosphate starvation-inducible protein PhoH and related proteins
MVALFGARDELLRIIEGAFTCSIHVRGNEITISGDRGEVETAASLFDELVELLARGHTIDA